MPHTRTVQTILKKCFSISSKARYLKRQSNRWAPIITMLSQMLFLTCLLCLNLPAPGCKLDRTEGEIKNYNVILISLDTLRKDRLNCYGYGRPTSKNIDRLAENGVLFENAVSTASWTLPSHVSLFTSLYPPAHGIEFANLALPSSETTVTEILKENGYRTGAFCGGGFLKSQFGLSQGFDIYKDNLSTRLHNILPPALEWLGKNMEGKFFLFLHCYDIHYPCFPFDQFYREIYTSDFNRLPVAKLDKIIDKYKHEGDISDCDLDDLVFLYHKYFDKISELKKKYGKEKLSALRKRLDEHLLGRWQKSPHYEEDLALIKGLYDGEILATDKQLKALLDFLTVNKMWNKTLIIITSDHGEGLMDHGILGHVRNHYDELIKIPLIVVFPDGKYKKMRIKETVRIIDIMPTILDYLGIHNSRLQQKVQGVSLMPMVDGRSLTLPAFSSTSKVVKLTSIVWNNYKLIINRESEIEELYDLSSDPFEKVNLIRKRPIIREKLLSELKEIEKKNETLRGEIKPGKSGKTLLALDKMVGENSREDQKAPEKKSNKVIIDEELKIQLEYLGYFY